MLAGDKQPASTGFRIQSMHRIAFQHRLTVDTRISFADFKAVFQIMLTSQCRPDDPRLLAVRTQSVLQVA